MAAPAPWKIALLVGVALAAAGAAVGLALLAEPSAPAALPADPEHGAMEGDARCAHMPEHCGGAAGG